MWINLSGFLTEGSFGSCLGLLDRAVGPVQVSRCPGGNLGSGSAGGWMELESVVLAMHWNLALQIVAEQWLKNISAEVLMLWQYFSAQLSQQPG